MLVDAVVASVELTASEPSHIPVLEASLRHTVEVPEPLQSGARRGAPELVGVL